MRTARSAATALVAGVVVGATPLLSSAQELSFERYRNEIERIFIAPRGGHGPSISPCATCHITSGRPLKLQPLETRENGSVYWTEE